MNQRSQLCGAQPFHLSEYFVLNLKYISLYHDILPTRKNIIIGISRKSRISELNQETKLLIKIIKNGV